MPLDTRTLIEQSFFLVQQANKPLAGRRIGRPLAPLVKLYGMLDAVRLFDQRRAESRKRAAGFLLKMSDCLPRLLDVFSLQRLVKRVGRIRIEAFPPWGAELNLYQPAIFADYLPQRQIELPPPLHVGGITKGADHENAGALFDACALVGKDRYRSSEERCDGVFAEQRLVSLDLPLSNNSDTGR